MEAKWQKVSWSRVISRAEWYCNIVYLEVSKIWANMDIFLELVDEEEDKNNVPEA